MKANEVPDRLYISDSELNDAEHCVIWFKSQQNENDIEYVRKDSFIEKACEWLKQHSEDYDYTWYDETESNRGITDKCIEDFKKYMKGE